MRIEALARFPLGQLPTPIEELKSLSREVGGPELLIKRDDQLASRLAVTRRASSSFLLGRRWSRGRIRWSRRARRNRIIVAKPRRRLPGRVCVASFC